MGDDNQVLLFEVASLMPPFFGPVFTDYNGDGVPEIVVGDADVGQHWRLVEVCNPLRVPLKIGATDDDGFFFAVDADDSGYKQFVLKRLEVGELRLTFATGPFQLRVDDPCGFLGKTLELSGEWTDSIANGSAGRNDEPGEPGPGRPPDRGEQ